jgi:hypothetical protein
VGIPFAVDEALAKKCANAEAKLDSIWLRQGKVDALESAIEALLVDLEKRQGSLSDGEDVDSVRKRASEKAKKAIEKGEKKATRRRG